MSFSRKAKELIKGLGFDPDMDYSDDDLRYELECKVSDLLQYKGFDRNYDVTETGMLCEDILDYLVDMYGEEKSAELYRYYGKSEVAFEHGECYWAIKGKDDLWEFYSVKDESGEWYDYGVDFFEQNFLRVDYVETLQEYRSVVADVDRKAKARVEAMVQEEVDKYGDEEFIRSLSTFHRFVSEKKRILKEEYGIDWKSVIELNPKHNFD